MKGGRVKEERRELARRKKTGKIVKERIEKKGEIYTRQKENKPPITYFQCGIL